MQKKYLGVWTVATVIVVMLLAAACSNGGGPVGNIDFTWLAGGGNDVQLDATQLVNGVDIVSYHWDYGDGNSGTTTQDIVHHIYAAAGDYSVTLTGTDSLGHVYTITHTVSASP